MNDDPMAKVPERVCGRSVARVANGRLAPEQVQKVIRAGFPKLRACYDEGQSRNPKLTGKVVVKMVVNREGRVENPLLVESSAADGGDEPVTTLHDERVTRCVLDGFRGLVFPKPDGGVVTVVYPVTFTPGDGARVR